MKIAIITTDDRQTFRDYGNPCPRYEKAQQALLEGFARLTDVEVHVISCLQKPVSSPGKLAGNIWCHSLHVPKIGWLRTLYQGCIRRIRMELKAIAPDIVHGQGTERECALSAVFSGCPNVVTVHGNMRAVAEKNNAGFGGYYWCAAKLEPFTLKKTIGVFCNSDYTRSLVAAQARKTWYVPNAIRTAFLDHPAVEKIVMPPVLLNVGVVSSYKRQRELLTVARNLWNRGLKFQVQFAGVIPDNSYAQNFRRDLMKAETQGYAKHLGTLNPEELIAAMDRASAMVHVPSEESFGLVAAEALARNLKLFISATGGLVDVCNGIPSAESFQQADWAGLEQSLARWLAQGEFARTESAPIIRKRYHPEVIARKHLEIYREVLANC